MADYDIHRKLYCSSSDGDETLVRELLTAGANPNKYKDSCGDTALFEAAFRGNESIVSTLIHHGADLNIQNKNQETALFRSAVNRNKEVTRKLIEAGADLNIQNKDGETALYRAAVDGNSEFTAILIQSGANLNIQNKDGETALHRAARRRNNDITSKLIEAGADLDIQNKDGETALYKATWSGNNEFTTKMIKAGADLNIQNKNGETALYCAARRGDRQFTTKLIKAGADLNTALFRAAENGNNKVTTTLIEAGADLNIQKSGKIFLKTALKLAATNGHGDVVTTLVEAGARVSSLASRMMNTDPNRISSVLDFLSKKLDQFQDNQNIEDYQETKEILGIETKKGKDKIMFYNDICTNISDSKTLLEYIDSQNVRLSRQREELIDLSVKIANLNHTGRNEDEKDTKKARDEVINHYKNGLPSGVGLRDMITMIKERYPWSSSKRKIMIFFSLMTCLLAIGHYVLDLSTDVSFSLEMFNKTLGNDVISFNASSFFSKNGLKFSSNISRSLASQCLTDLEAEYDRRINSTSASDILDENYKLTGWISIWHCVQPFVATMIVFLNMKFFKEGKCSVPNQPEYLRDKSRWCFSSLLCCIPLPAITNLYRFYLDVRCHQVRSKPEFRNKIVNIEKEIREHEALGKL